VSEIIAEEGVARLA